AAYGLSGAGPTEGPFTSDAWVPDSKMWVDVARSTTEGIAKAAPTGTSVATTPLVIALPSGPAARLGQASWRMLSPTTGGAGVDGQLKLYAPDPARTASGMAALIIARRLSGVGDDERRSLPLFTALIRQLQQSSVPDVSTAFAALDRPGKNSATPAAVVTEQAVWERNRATSDAGTAAVYPGDGTVMLEYPLVLTTTESAKVQAVADFREALMTGEARDDVHAGGFRGLDGAAGRQLATEGGLRPATPPRIPPPSGDAVKQSLQAWSRLKLGTRMLTLIDVSGSMAEPVPGTGVTRMQATAQTAIQGLRLFPDDSELGLWSFSTFMNGQRDYRELQPIMPLYVRHGGVTSRERQERTLSRIRPNPVGDTGLYDSILAGYREVKRGYQPDKVNTLLVLTDGRNDDPVGLTLEQLQARLRAEFDPERPVAIISIAFGPDIDANVLRQITALTNGAAYVTDDPAKIKSIFLESIALRICSPNCPKS
ncbi:MAG: VWA domain-containing protein, partial [Streptosporangiales bacterium]|nr:VWA domain-containing protein [Streptosporangiales bacterium]